MSTIRRQSIFSSLVIYVGFAIGLLNTYFLGKEGYFSQEEYGLTGIFVAIASMMMAFSVLGMPAYVYKFFPYYKDHLPLRKHDMFTWALLITCIGCLLTLVAGILLKEVIVRKFSANSQLLIQYYYWIFPLGFGLTIYTLLEVYAWCFNKSVFTSYLRETQWRLFTTILIVLFMVKIVPSFDLFIKLYAFSYPSIALTLFIYLLATKKIHFTFTVSKVTRRYFKQILKLCSFVYAANLIMIVSQVFDSIVIAAVLKDGLTNAGIFALAQIMASVIQAPQRAVVAASMSHLSQAWKDKNMALLQRVYQRSSINMLIFSCGLYILIALNYKEAIVTFGLKESFLLGFNAFLVLGLMRIIDMGTGVNAQIIATSTWWKFELISGVLLLALMVPLTYFFTKSYGIIGPAFANLISVTMYNTVRIVFLQKKFRLFPFSMRSLYTLLLAGGCFVICYFLFSHMQGLVGMIVRSAVFLALYAAGVIGLDLSPDVKPVLASMVNRLKRTKE